MRSEPRMRHASVAAVLLLFLATLAFAANPTFEARSQRFGLQIEIVSTDNSAEYVARVTDLTTGQVIAAPHVVADKESITEAGDRTIRVHVYEEANGIGASLYVEQGETLL